MHTMDHDKINAELEKLLDSEGLDIQLSFDGMQVPINLQQDGNNRETLCPLASIIAGKSCVSWGSCPELEFTINPKLYPEYNTSCENPEIIHMPMNDSPI